MPKRNYSNVAPPLPLSVAVTAASTTLTVSSTTGYPAAPFLLGLERGTANEEVVLCTATTATTFTVTRAYDGTTAKSHGIGTMVEHTVAAIDYREAAVVALTTAERDALAGADLWDGRLISNTTTDTLDRYNSGVGWESYAKTSSPTFSGTVTFTGTTIVGDGEQDVSQQRAVDVETHGRDLTLGYTGSDLTTITEKDGSTTVRTITLTYTSGKVTQTVEVAGGKTITTDLVYTGNDLTAVNRSVV